MGNETLPPGTTLPTLVRNFSYDCSHKKALVPRVHEKPVLGLRSDKNFIVTNAIENILSTAKAQEDSIDWLKKQSYGEIPEYLRRIKENIQGEYRMIQNLHAKNSEEKYPFHHAGTASRRRRFARSATGSSASGTRSTATTRRSRTFASSTPLASSAARRATRRNWPRSRRTSRSSTSSTSSSIDCPAHYSFPLHQAHCIV
jgi:hypothetical protein